MHIRVILATSLALLAAACGTQTTPELPSGDISQPLQIAQSCAGDYPDAPFTVQGVRVEGDMLAVRVGYAGGCKPHDFFVCWRDGSFLETDPVQARLAIFHDAHGDMCEAYITQERYIDLAPLRQAYQSGYGQDEGTMVVRIDGTEHSVEYTF